ncbi:hypothetical protein ACFQU9_45090 [Actinomadura namibiensis]|uniref:hypothetical protein n=1 Tax=Actinomadura kijaniata TaxID=46161 RepID=UPI00361523D1
MAVRCQSASSTSSGTSPPSWAQGRATNAAATTGTSRTAAQSRGGRGGGRRRTSSGSNARSSARWEAASSRVARSIAVAVRSTSQALTIRCSDTSAAASGDVRPSTRCRT